MDYQEPDTQYQESRFRKLVHSIFQVRESPDTDCPATKLPAEGCLCDQRDFVARLQHAINRAERNRHALALILLQIQGEISMKTESCDALTRRIGGCLRRSDSLLHLGRGKFAILLEDVRDLDCIPFAVEKFRHILALPLHGADIDTPVTANAGVSVFPDDGCRINMLWNRAESALDDAISTGPGCFRFANAQLIRYAMEKMQMSTALHRALRNDEFELLFQPLVEIDTGQVQRIECLLRWNHPEQGLLSPDRFLHLLEETGLILSVGEWVIDMTCRTSARLRAEGHHDIRLCINISERQFQDPDFASTLECILVNGGYEPSLIELECSETALMRDPPSSRKRLGQLADLGVPVSIDHFGGNNYALTELMRMPVSGLKIDRDLIRRLPFDRTYRAITGGILTFADGVGLRTGATGVENVGQLQFLRDRACNEAQGYLFSRPLGYHELEHWLPN